MLPIQKYLPDVSSELVHILNRALEKDPEDRYQGVHDMVIDLRRLKKQTSRVSRIVPTVQPSEGPAEPPSSEGARAAWLSRIPQKMKWVLVGLIVVVLGVLLYVIVRPGAGSPSATEQSIAVLYFENKTGREDLDKMLVGLLNINLTRNRGLSVVSGQRLYDVLKTLGKQDAASIDKTTATEVAKRAGVRSMLVGTIWNVSGKVTALAELLDVESGSVLNSAHVEVPSADEVFTLADGITEKVNEWFKATPGETLRSSDAATSSYDAFKSYEKGMRHIYRFEYPEAIKSFEEAVRLDSTFALAHLRLGYCRGFPEVMDFFAGRNLELARQSLSRARNYDRNLSERDKRFVQAWEALLGRDFKTFVAVMRELAVEFPQDQEVALSLGLGCEWLGLFDEARVLFEKAIEFDRSYSDAYNFLAYVCAFTGRSDEAISAAKSYTALIPDAWNGYDSECEVYMMLGRYEEALRRADEGLRRFPEHLGFHGRRAQTYFLMGQPEKARAAIKPWWESGRREAMAGYTSLSYLIEGRIKEATDVLRQAIERSRAKNDRENELQDQFSLAKMFLEQQKFEEAVKLLEIAKSLSEQVFKGEFNPWPVMCDYYSGLCFIRKGDHAQAEAKAAAIKTAAETKLHDLYYLNLSLGLQAEIELTQGKIHEASNSMGEMTPIVRKGFPRFIMLHGRIAALLGDRMRSQSLYDKTYNIVIYQMFDFYDFWLERSKLDYYKAQTYEHFGDKAEAIKFYEKAIYNWRDADKDYVSLVDAQNRLAKLRGLSKK
ncbi:MAG: Tetratricopeptide repeat protein [Bacteroidetes bacterium]|nr:Tetratricopeptide repeat protein [Bacteroidota bacterium]